MRSLKIVIDILRSVQNVEVEVIYTLFKKMIFMMPLRSKKLCLKNIRESGYVLNVLVKGKYI